MKIALIKLMLPSPVGRLDHKSSKETSRQRDPRSLKHSQASGILLITVHLTVFAIVSILSWTACRYASSAGAKSVFNSLQAVLLGGLLQGLPALVHAGLDPIGIFEDGGGENHDIGIARNHGVQV